MSSKKKIIEDVWGSDDIRSENTHDSSVCVCYEAAYDRIKQYKFVESPNSIASYIFYLLNKYCSFSSNIEDKRFILGYINNPNYYVTRKFGDTLIEHEFLKGEMIPVYLNAYSIINMSVAFNEFISCIKQREVEILLCVWSKINTFKKDIMNNAIMNFFKSCAELRKNNMVCSQGRIGTYLGSISYFIGVNIISSQELIATILQNKISFYTQKAENTKHFWELIKNDDLYLSLPKHKQIECDNRIEEWISLAGQ